MAHSYGGFSVKARGTIADCVTQSAEALKLGQQQLIALQKDASGPGAAAYKRWFGTLTADRLKRVTEVVALMDFALNSGRIQFTYNESCGATTNAAAFRPTHGWKVSELKETLSSGTFKISLCPRFFGALPQDAQDQQSRTGTFIHELSHIVGNTDDIVKNGVTMYGRNFARILADRFPADAVNNAENYGMYGTWLLRKEEAEPEFALADLFG